MLMASTSHNQTSYSSSSTSLPTEWDVFLSFRGSDTRHTFTDYLYHSLDRCGIRTFRDVPGLRSGEFISAGLLQAIQESKMYVVVLSENYASSRWCLDELVEILRRCESMDRLVIPVFYDIEPWIVRHQTGSYYEAFQEHKNRFDGDRLDKWRLNLTKVADLSGYEVHKSKSQTDVINEIVDRVLHEINPVTLNVAKYQVGLDSHVKDIAKLFSNVTTGVIRIGLYGMGGVGKTTLAKAVYNQNHHRFQGSCFLENVREASQTRKGIADLQQKLVTDVLKCKNITIDNADQGIEIIRARICSQRVLVVIDDLDSTVPLEFLEGPFGLGSTIIITTRHEDLLDSIDVKAKYKVKELDDVEAHQLFCQHAFGGDNRMPDTYSELSKEILKRAGGLPLALKVCGSALINQSDVGWRVFVDQLRGVSIAGVEEILLISFDALVDPMLKDIFLDIACFFIGHLEGEVVRIMETCYTSVNYYIDILKKRSLLTISIFHGFMMHDLLLDMARKIASNNSPNAFRKHSRLWEPESIHEVLKDNKGAKAIEGIIPSNFAPYSDSFRERRHKKTFNNASVNNQYAAETFKRMSKLRFLYLKNVDLTGSFEHTFKELRWLYWEHCPLKCLPFDFSPQKLVCLELPGSKMRSMCELNMGSQVFKNLKNLDMSRSHDLTTISDFHSLPCLETLNLVYCTRLEEVHESIGSLTRLVSLNLGFCRNLKSLPDSLCNLKALKSLNLDNCWDLKAIPMNIGNIESLVWLNARWLALCKLPDSIGRLSRLVQLNLFSCVNLKTLPGTICNLRSLEVLDIGYCSSLKALPAELGNLESLVQLRAGNLIISELPNSIGCLSRLVLLDLSNCDKLKTLPDIMCNLKSLTSLDIRWCSSLEALPPLPSAIGNLEPLRQHYRLIAQRSLAQRILDIFNLLTITELPFILNLIREMFWIWALHFLFRN